jgi:hypothetical protein
MRKPKDTGNQSAKFAASRCERALVPTIRHGGQASSLQGGCSARAALRRDCGAHGMNLWQRAIRCRDKDMHPISIDTGPNRQ